MYPDAQHLAVAQGGKKARRTLRNRVLRHGIYLFLLSGMCVE